MGIRRLIVSIKKGDYEKFNREISILTGKLPVMGLMESTKNYYTLELRYLSLADLTSLKAFVLLSPNYHLGKIEEIES